MSFFDDAGAWFDQAGKDAGQGFKDVTKAVFHDGPKDVMNEIATGDVMQGIWNAQDDFSQVVYDVFNPNDPDPNSVVDQIENTIDQQSTPDYSTNKVETNDVNYSRGSDVLMNFNSTEADLGIDSFTTASGLKITDHVAGIGVEASSGQIMEVHYRGMLEDGTQFDASYDRGTFTFPLGAGRVISGWEEGIAGMKVGGKRTLEIPPVLGYGARGAGGVIPPHATLIFEVELIAVDGNRNVSSLVATDAMFETYDPITNPNPVFEGTVSEFIEPNAFGTSGNAGTVIEPIDELQGISTMGIVDDFRIMPPQEFFPALVELIVPATNDLIA